MSADVISRARSIVETAGAEMEAHSPRTEQPIERGRQHVLAGVLLHVVEAARPVDDAVDALADGRGGACSALGLAEQARPLRLNDVKNVAGVIVFDVDDARAAEVPTSNGWPPDVG